jgi:tRNA G37 N-methylase Trm5
MFCGIGPLAVQAGLKGNYVIANDLNPDCFRYL